MDEPITLPEHEQHSEARAAGIRTLIKEKAMSHEGMMDKVDVHNIFKPGHGDGDGGMGGAPWAAILPALASERHGRDGWGGGVGAFAGAALGSLLLGNRRGGLFGGGDCDGNGGAETRIESDIFNTAILTKLGSIESSIPLAQAQTENVILQQTNQITNLANQNAMANQAGFAQTKDAIQNTAALTLTAISNVNQNLLTTGCAIERQITNDGEKTRGLITSIFQTQQAERINALNAEVIELREEGRRAEAEARRVTDVNALRSSIEINNTASATQNQQQAQFQVQAQFQDINSKMNRLFDMVNIVHQEARATNQNIVAGNTGAVVTGPQNANPTNVNTR